MALIRSSVYCDSFYNCPNSSMMFHSMSDSSPIFFNLYNFPSVFFPSSIRFFRVSFSFVQIPQWFFQFVSNSHVAFSSIVRMFSKCSQDFSENMMGLWKEEHGELYNSVFPIRTRIGSVFDGIIDPDPYIKWILSLSSSQKSYCISSAYLEPAMVSDDYVGWFPRFLFVD